MTYLITGGTGFIGVELAKRLLERGDSVILFDLKPNMDAIAGIADRVSVVTGDISGWPEVMNAVAGNSLDCIFHLSAMLSIPADENPWAAYRVNANGTMHVLEAARIFGVKQVIFPGTMAVLAGNTGDIDESTATKPDSMYGVTKLFGELLGRFYHRKFGMDFRGLRFCTVVGLGARTKHMTQYMAWMIERSLQGEPFEVWVKEETSNPFIYYQDAVSALLMLRDAPEAQIQTRIYNLAGTMATAGAFADAVRRHIGGARITFQPDPTALRLFGGGTGAVDESAAQEEWGWKPEYDLEKTILDMKTRFAEGRHGL